MKSEAISLARVSASIVAVILAVLAIGHSDPPGIQLPLVLKLGASCVGIFLIWSMASLIDSAVDAFDDNDWRGVLETEKGTARKPRTEATNHDNWNQIPARARLFGGGYLLLAIGLAFVSLLLGWFLLQFLDAQTPLTLIVITAQSLAVVAKMMTKKSGAAYLPLLAIVLVFILIAVFGADLAVLSERLLSTD